MCGGGGDKSYNAYSSGDFNQWKSIFDQVAEVELAVARGELSEEEGQQRIQAITNPAPPAPPEPSPAPSTGTTTTADGRVLRQRYGSKDAMVRAQSGVVSSPSKTPQEQRREALLAARQPTPSSVDFSSLANRIKEDPSAAMEMRELERQHKVGLGKIGIDKAFSNFGDDYYSGYQNDYTGYYFPQLDRQYGDVVDKLTATLAGRGILESSVGANKFANLARDHAEARTNIQNEAIDAANKLRGQVENAKSNLYSLNEASADPQAVNAQAIGQATALVAPPTYSPLGQVFANVFDSFGNFMNARQNRPSRQYQSPYSAPSGYGSGQVVR